MFIDWCSRSGFPSRSKIGASLHTADQGNCNDNVYDVAAGLSLIINLYYASCDAIVVAL